MHKKTDATRRTLLKTLAAAPLAGVVFYHGAAFAAHLEESDKNAAALGYKHASPVAGKSCGNCKLWQGGAADWGACTLFPGKEVAKGGHCNSWVAAG